MNKFTLPPRYAQSPCQSDSGGRFRPQGLKYKVQIKVEVNAGFLWAVAKCLFKRKELLITHTFTNDPLLEPDFKIDAR